MREVSNLPQPGGAPETQGSWFKGYAWTVLFCDCGEHLGWRFTATNPGAQPDSFYGIRRSTIEWQ